ncbi:MAG TPA: DUF1688 family protein, partial [Ramlibacter sp.]|nr:DUF1688 family protein [Ramlibacter sp.]
MTAVVGDIQAEEAASALRTTRAIRERCGQLLTRARAGESSWFIVDDGFLESAAKEVVAATRERYPRLHVPYHSRWRHFEAGGVDRKGELERQLHDLPRPTLAHAMVDLTFVSVLLDGGAGADWSYVEPATGHSYTRSEGLAVASFHAFNSGLFSSNKNRPCQVDADGLRGLSTDHLANAFQVRDNNALVGLESRAVLLRRLGEAMLEQPEAFGEDARPAGLFDSILTPFGATEPPPTADVAAHDILSELLRTCSGIWPSGNAIGGVPLGDCWKHSAVRGEGLTDGWVPF